MYGEKMLTIIIIKEFFDNILNLRFIVGFILCIIITMSCVIILSNDYQQEMRDYQSRIALQDQFLNNYAHTNRIGGMIVPQKPPEQFRPLIIGIPDDADLGSYDDNPLPVLFQPLDLIFIVTIIMSLMAILFSYDAIAGEREKGTLKLMISNSISRANLLLGKWIGGTLSLLIPFIFSLLISTIYITLNPNINWDSSAWATFFLFLLASIIFIAAFYFLGLLVSSFSKYASTSILTSLFLWVIFILVIPNLSPYIAAQLYRIPSVNKIEKEVNRIQGIERDELGRKLSKDVTKKYEQQYGQMFTELQGMNRDAIRQRTESDPEFKAMYRAYTNESNGAWQEANRIQTEKADKIWRELDNKSRIQTFIAKHIACLSPYANYVYLATDLTGTGLHSLSYFSRVASEYYATMRSYLQSKEEQARQKDPTFGNNSFLNVSDRPRFIYREEPLLNRLGAGLPYWGFLLFFNVLFFVLAFVRFLRYDVR
jgi:ABC-type transport system involved in multi-copper enzyme maturation permease subunit